jgi:hypothetical protein
MNQKKFIPPNRKFTEPAGGFGPPTPPSCEERTITNAGDRQGPFTYEFMVPEETDDYGSGTIFIRVPDNPVEEEKHFIIEQTVMFFVRFDTEKNQTFLLERRVLAD